MAKKEAKEKKGFIWYSLRISFWTLVVTYILTTLFGFLIPGFNELPKTISALIGLFFLILMFFTFIVSIIHLFKHKKKALAISALIVSGLLILMTFAVAFLAPAA